MTAAPPMPEPQAHLLGILRQHGSRATAVHLPDLWERWSGHTLRRDDDGRIIDDVPTRTRGMRDMIDQLRDVWGVPVLSSAHSGYWIVTDRTELAGVVTEFRSRGLKSLGTAARLQQLSLVEAVQQLALDLQDDASDISQHLHRHRRTRRRIVRDTSDLVMSPDARLAVISAHLQGLLDDPDTYAQQLHDLRRRYGVRLLPRDTVERLRGGIRSATDTATRALAELDQLRSLLPDETPNDTDRSAT